MIKIKWIPSFAIKYYPTFWCVYIGITLVTYW